MFYSVNQYYAFIGSDKNWNFNRSCLSIVLQIVLNKSNSMLNWTPDIP